MTQTEFNAKVNADIHRMVAAAQTAQMAAEEARITELENEGMTRSDAQSAYEAEQF